MLLKDLLLPENLASLNECSFLHKVECPGFPSISAIQLRIDSRIEKFPLGKEALSSGLHLSEFFELEQIFGLVVFLNLGLLIDLEFT
jgi:hypothetical protein